MRERLTFPLHGCRSVDKIRAGEMQDVVRSGAFAFYRDDPSWDGQARFVGSRPVAGFPLVVTSTMAVDAMMASWWRELFETFGTSLVVSIAIHILAQTADRREFTRTLLAQEHEGKVAAESANRAKSMFLATMSHEIRTPINGILGLTHLLLAHSLDAPARRQVEAMATSANRLLGILNGVLDLSKVEAGKMAVERVPFGLERLIDDTVALVRPAVESKGLELSVRIDPGIPRHLFGDPLRIGQALLNFVGNAAKFTERGSIAVGVEPAESREAAVVLRFSVTDTGIGLTPAQQGKLFQAFEQADDTITRTYGGTGLGLAITKRIVQVMGGQVGLDSVAGAGSTFWFTVPVGRAEADIIPASEVIGGAGTLAGRPPLDHDVLLGTRVLLVEDDAINQMVAVGLLEAAGMAVDMAGDGETAIRMVGEKDYEIVLMDTRMPGMDGLAATRLIRRQKPADELPIIALTANAMERHQQECLAAGMNDFIGKPFEPGQLYSVIQKWVTGLGGGALFDAPGMSAMLGADIHLPSHIDGLDLRAGLRRVAGMRTLYVNVLRGFMDQRRDAVDRIRQSLAAGDVDNAGRDLHTLKGLAGMIEAPGLRDLAAGIEAALGDRDLDGARGLLGRLDGELARLYDAVGSALAASRSDGSPGTESPSRDGSSLHASPSDGAEFCYNTAKQS